MKRKNKLNDGFYNGMMIPLILMEKIAQEKKTEQKGILGQAADWIGDAFSGVKDWTNKQIDTITQSKIDEYKQRFMPLISLVGVPLINHFLGKGQVNKMSNPKQWDQYRPSKYYYQMGELPYMNNMNNQYNQYMNNQKQY